MTNKIGRNDPCLCGSGKKYKQCCMRAEAAQKASVGTTNENISNTLREAIGYYQAGQLSEAEAACRKLLQISPDHPDALHMLGMIANQQGMYDVAELCIGRMLKIAPNFADAHNNLGVALKEQGKLEEAIASYRKAVFLNPAHANAHYNLGNALKEQGLLEEAVSSYKRAIKLKPDYAKAHNNLGETLQAQGKLDEAEASYRMALHFKPGFAVTHNMLGLVIQELGKLDEAEASYREAIRLKPDLAVAHNNLGVLFQKMGRTNEAETSYREAIRSKPDFAVAHGNLASLLYQQGQFEAALPHYQQQVKLMPVPPETQHLIASLTGANTERAPSQYVEGLFNLYADTFDAHLQQQLKYETPDKLAALIARHVSPAGQWDVLDLGCGTGLMGAAIAPFSRGMVGVDLSEKMLEKARVRNLYRRLECSDLLTMMRGETASSYDLVMAADVFVYVGKLDEIVGEVKRLLRPGGFFAFSVESLEKPSGHEARQGGEQGYRLQKTGRYAHAEEYLTRLAIAEDFRVQEIVDAQIRIDRGVPIVGYHTLWKKN